MLIPVLLFLLDILCWRFFAASFIKSLLCFGVASVFKRRNADISSVALIFLLMVEMTLFMPSGLHVGLFLLSSLFIALLVRSNLELPWYWSQIIAFLLVFILFYAHRGLFSHTFSIRSTLIDLLVNLGVILGVMAGTWDDRASKRS